LICGVDGWSENEKGHLLLQYHAANTWGETRPIMAGVELRQYLRDNALMWFEEYHIEGCVGHDYFILQALTARRKSANAIPEG